MYEKQVKKEGSSSYIPYKNITEEMITLGFLRFVCAGLEVIVFVL